MESLLNGGNTLAGHKNTPSGDFIAALRTPGGDGLLAFVADMPGAPSPAQAQLVRDAWDSVARQTLAHWDTQPGPQLAATALSEFSRELRAHKVQCCGSIALVKEGQLHTGGLGDTVVILHSAANRVRFTFEEPGKPGYLGSSEVIYPAASAGLSGNARLGAISGSYPESGITSGPIANFTHLLLFSDGLWEVLPDFHQRSDGLSDSATIHRLVDDHTPASAGALRDDITFAVIDLTRLREAPVVELPARPPAPPPSALSQNFDPPTQPRRGTNANTAITRTIGPANAPPAPAEPAPPAEAQPPTPPPALALVSPPPTEPSQLRTRVARLLPNRLTAALWLMLFVLCLITALLIATWQDIRELRQDIRDLRESLVPAASQKPQPGGDKKQR